MLYRYVKAPPTYINPPVSSPRNRGLVLSYVSIGMGMIGIMLIAWVIYPLLSFELKSRLMDKEVVKSVTNTGMVAAAADELETAPESVDLTKASTWYPDRPQGATRIAGTTYLLTIPKLRIKDAVVKIAGDDLNKSLIHYGGTGLPGDYGTAVIFGHSILPIFYNPSNYKAIFSRLTDLEKGDEIFVKYDGITYRYVVIATRITTPDDISVLEQRYDASYVSLITCVPPGTYLKRLEVKARLEPL